MNIENNISNISAHMKHDNPGTIPVTGSVYFIGIGGIGMSAIARYFKLSGLAVSGYDKTQTLLTKQLQQEGIDIHFTDDINQADTKAALVIYTPAVPKNHQELNFFKQHGFNLQKRSEVLGSITKENFNICVAGTHGKTTTSAMVAHLLTHTGYGCNAFLGGIATNYATNFISSTSKNCVVEADEYDRSFLQLNPDIAIVTAMDADHLDIYGTEKNMQDSFIEFTKGIKPGGTLIIKKGLQRADEFDTANKISYHLTDTNADVYAKDINVRSGAYFIDMQLQEETWPAVELNMGGRHNIENMLAAVMVAKLLEIPEEKIREAVKTFKGVKRRFETIYKSEDLVYIDDYAHHPEELRALINSAKELYEGYELTVIFQPHLFTRTRDLSEGFAEVLSLADETILLPIYPARELPIEGVNSEMVAKNLKNKNRILNKEAVADFVKDKLVDGRKHLIITAGAGDIDTMIEPLKNILKENKKN